MGKVFNDQIIKILCAKNLSKVRKEIGEPNISSKYGGLRRGESYVVFLDKQQRKDLHHQMSIMEKALTPPTTTALCTVSKRNSGTTRNYHTWLKSSLNKPHKCEISKSFTTRLCDSLHSFGQIIMRRKSVSDYISECSLPRWGTEHVPTIPPIFGPFLDESICATLDRLFYCICRILGHRMEPLEFYEN